MKRLPTALAATALLALAGCGSHAANNITAVDTSNDVYNVSPDDLTLNDLGNNAMGGNMSGGGNMSTGGNASSGNSHAASTNSHSSASHAARNTH